MPEFIEESFKTILNTKKYIDPWFWDRYSINPYNGCLFGCIYCDARSSKYHMPEDFENKIIVKKDVSTLLDKKISNSHKLLKDVISIGGVTDPYQSVEKIYRNTYQTLEILLKHKFPVHVVTKSDLILEDAELINEIALTNWSTVSITITSLNPELSKFLDYRAPSPQRRLEVIKKLKETFPKIQCGVLMIPLIPYINDDERDLKELIIEAKKAKADYILFAGGMTLRDVQAKWFLKHLTQKFPELLSMYESLYNFKYDPLQYVGNHSPNSGYVINKQLELIKLCKQYEMPYRIKRFIPEDYRRINYLISEQLLAEAYEKKTLGQSYKSLFWAGQNIQNLLEPIENLVLQNKLSSIRNVMGQTKVKVMNLFNNLAQSSS